MPAAAKRKKSVADKAAPKPVRTEPAPLGAMVMAQAKVAKEMRRDLLKIANDLWWSWNEIAQRPFAALDPIVWEASNHDPLAVLRQVDEPVFAARCADADFCALVKAAHDAHRAYHGTVAWFEQQAFADAKGLHIAYFCSEFAIHESLQQYSGGLGVLAGDHLKSASDLGIPLTAVGLLYQQGYYLQQLRADGTTRVIEPRWDPRRMPLEDTGVDIRVPIGDRKVEVRLWTMRVGRVKAVLMDTDRKANRPKDRRLTEGLYKGEPELRMRQQVLLGVGGVMALKALGIKASVFHLNEGHAAFASVARLAQLRRKGESLEDALQRIRASTVFTTHTPVPAGHDRYDAEMVADALQPCWREAGLARRAFLDMGSERPADPKAPFCMTVLALRTAEHVNGVAALHGRVSREMWQQVYGVADAAMVPIGHVTNGVHARTWLAPEAETFWKRSIGLDLDTIERGKDPWAAAEKADAGEFWAMRAQLRARLVQFIRERLARQARRRGEAPEAVVRASQAFDPNALTIGFARRFATYKRAPLIFREPERLRRILSDSKRPLQIVFAGKAHPRDRDGQAYAAEVHRWTREQGFEGRVALIEEYDMHVGRMLVSGCDVWLNNPLRPHEASGTSGMKPPMHGGVNLSILDGWWPESFDGRNGWAIGDGSEGTDREKQDALDAESLYALLENEVVPSFYQHDRAGLPQDWIARALHSVATVPGRFNTHRMVAEYLEKSYLPANA
ncbi:MAG: alpha-glucan family phosphorylase [Phycisphaerales bacterium]